MNPTPTAVTASIVQGLAFCLLVHAAAAAAEEPPIQREEVVVTATRTRARADDVTGSVSVITADDIEQGGSDRVGDALRITPGVDVTTFGSPGQSAFVSIRGAAPDQVLVLLDGVEVNSPTVGQFDFANLTTENIDHIEVLRGGGGALYGSEAIGGVVNVLSRRGDGPLRFSLSGDAGSAGTHREVLGISGARGPLSLSGTASFLASDGFRSINDDYRNFSTGWRGDADVLPGATLRGYLRYTNARAGLVNFDVKDGVLSPDAHSRSDFFLAKGEWEHALTDALTYRAAVSFVRDNERFQGRSTEEDDEGEVEEIALAQHFPSDIIAADTQWDYRWREIALTTVGLEFKERSAEIFQSITSEDPDVPAEVEHLNPNRSNVALYGQEQLRLLDDTLHAVGGVRYDHYDVFGDEVTGTGSASYLIRPTHSRLRVAYLEGFRAPTFNELFEPNLGNPNLKSEHSWEVNAGVTQDFFAGRARVDSTYFYREVRNLIEEVVDQLPGPIAVPKQDETGMPLTRNLNARLQGVEIVVRTQPIRGLSLWSNYTYLNFVTPTGVLLNRPRHRGSFGASAQWPGLFAASDHAEATVAFQAVGRRDSANPGADFDPAPIGSYARTDLSLAYHFGFTPLAVRATVRNLFNRDYAESIGFPAPPANFLIGLRYEL